MSDFKVKGFLFDMDGTLVDSTAVVENEWVKFSTHYGLDAREVIRFAHGRQTLDTVVHFLGQGEAANAASKVIDDNEVINLQGIVAVPGAAALLASLPVSAWALVTSAGRELATNRMKAAGLPLPAVMVCAEDVSTGKPSPEGYLQAASALGLPAKACAVFEDAEAGIRAGLASGARVIAVNPRAHGAAEAHVVAELTQFRVTRSEDGFTVCIKA